MLLDGIAKLDLYHQQTVEALLGWIMGRRMDNFIARPSTAEEGPTAEKPAPLPPSPPSLLETDTGSILVSGMSDMSLCRLIETLGKLRHDDLDVMKVTHWHP